MPPPSPGCEPAEAERRAEPLDIDASVEAAPGVFLPPGKGLFAFDGKSILKLAQAPIDSKIVKKKVVEQIFVPVPVVRDVAWLPSTGPAPNAESKTDNLSFICAPQMDVSQFRTDPRYHSRRFAGD